MVNLSFKKLEICAADLGPKNCLPDIHNNAYIRAAITLSDNVSAEDSEYIGKGMISTLLPYQIQDGYNRNRSVKKFDCAVLENEYLIATFIPELGGRLWSLFDKKQNRELLYKNDVFQPANLALRNAWFSGGVEWNVSIKGHNPLTCSPLFAQKVYNSYNQPVLKMYEYERIRGVSYGIYATLDKDILLIHPVIENTADQDKYMYWWSNIAVDKTPKTRVLAPAKETLYCSYSDGAYLLDVGKMPYINNDDITYPTNLSRSRDFFFKIPDNEKKWIAAVDGEGKGLVQFSNNYLKGRKVFVWGQQNGGKHWNKWLSTSGKPYIEIQAGILRTQLEHFIMSKNSTISWTEGYSFIKGDAQKVHSKDYTKAVKELEPIVNSKIDTVNKNAFEIVKEEPIEYYGSGWGALENRIRKTLISSQFDFPEDSINKEQFEWWSLLENNKLPEHNTNSIIESYVVGDYWLENLTNKCDKNWYSYYHLGVIYYAKGDYNKAAESFKKSNELEKNAWALRNIAQIEKNILGDLSSAAEHMKQALSLKGDYLPLAVDCANALISAKQYIDWINIYASLDDKLKANGRLKMMLAICYIRTDKIDLAKEIINKSLVVDDIQEGEYALSAIWCELYKKIMSSDEGILIDTITDEQVLEKYPLPFELDFRMH